MSALIQNALNTLTQAVERLDGAVVKGQQLHQQQIESVRQAAAQAAAAKPAPQPDLFNSGAPPRNDNGHMVAAGAGKGHNRPNTAHSAALAKTLDNAIARVEQLLKEEA